MLDFAVNVRAAAPPPWLTRRLAGRLAALGRYPSEAEDGAAPRRWRAARPRPRRGRCCSRARRRGSRCCRGLNLRLAAVVHPRSPNPSTRCGGRRRRRAGAARRRRFRLDPARCRDDGGPGGAGQPDEPDRRCCTRPTLCGRCAGRDAWWWSTRRSPTRSRVSRSRWRASRFPTCWCCAASPRRRRSPGLRVGYALGPADLLARLTPAGRTGRCRHAATGGDRGVQRTGGGRRGARARPT